MPYSITRREVAPRVALVQRKRATSGPEMSRAIGDALGAVFAHAQQHGIQPSGRPFARYLDTGPGAMTLEPGVFVSAPAGMTGADDDEVDDVRLVTIPGGPVATTLHRGPYETLHEAYAALEAWVKEQGLSPAGPPWEVYITDPTQVEDPSEWETEVNWPVA